jgi:hypothetical protein
MILLLLFKYAQLGRMKIGYSCDPNITASYHLFFLLKEKENRCRDTGGLACLHHGTFGQNGYSQNNKGMHKKKEVLWIRIPYLICVP